ncbi:BC1872 family protein [Pelosinus propionicus]|uniref:Phage ABA sandwich domain-containing protein n=1 Tax=Pelosinus propionicus DSM 13327 TaxID=1123291 RepID=A0A1I4N2K0_9FIRM|nr:hypothetical protein [Pelosinus propionicus]SFM09537.1 hypothetical protein SAMN04490355_104047 [Pelosinus propionicus DSM 13327]
MKADYEQIDQLVAREQILKMVPGRELDKQVAAEVMKWEDTGFGNSTFWDSNRRLRMLRGLGNTRKFNPSTDISEAWEVVEALKRKGLYMAFAMNRDTYNFSVWDSNGIELIIDWVRCKTAQEAICKAALLAVLGAE